MEKKRKELTEKLGRLVNESRVLIDEAEKEERSFTSEEDQTYLRIDKEISDIEEEIAREDRLEKQQSREDYLESRDREPLLDDPNREPGSIDSRDQDGDPRKTREYRSAFMSWVRGGEGALNQYQQRALSQGSDPGGGYTVPLEEFVRELIQKLDDTMPLRTLARGFQLVEAKSLGAPRLDTDPADADWTSEIATITEDTAMAFGKRELVPNPLAKLIKVSNKLLENSALPMDSIIQERISQKVFMPLETAYMTGSGSSQPLGLFTADADGISTSRDVDIGDTSGGITGFTSADKFITAAHTLRVPYWSNARWLFNRLILAALRKLKDGSSNNYLWQPGLAGGAPATFLDFPYVLSEFAPGTIGVGAYVAVLGDFNFYWYVDALNIRLQRLVELYAVNNQTGFIVRGEFDGMPVMEDAFVRCVLTA